jgi:hypothetical protein
VKALLANDLHDCLLQRLALKSCLHVAPPIDWQGFLIRENAVTQMDVPFNAAFNVHLKSAKHNGYEAIVSSNNHSTSWYPKMLICLPTSARPSDNIKVLAWFWWLLRIDSLH